MALLRSGAHPNEVQTAVDLLTTNETHFSGKSSILSTCVSLCCSAINTQVFRCGSAASSSGEEAYSVAMVLEDGMQGALGGHWHLTLAPECSRMARRALYPMERACHIPEHYLKRFCREKGERNTAASCQSEVCEIAFSSFMQT